MNQHCGVRTNYQADIFPYANHTISSVPPGLTGFKHIDKSMTSRPCVGQSLIESQWLTLFISQRPALETGLPWVSYFLVDRLIQISIRLE
jgi:hypothetical protein